MARAGLRASDFVRNDQEFIVWSADPKQGQFYDSSPARINTNANFALAPTASYVVGEADVALEAVCIDPTSDAALALVQYLDPTVVKNSDALANGNNESLITVAVNPMSPLWGRIPATAKPEGNILIFPAMDLTAVNGLWNLTPYDAVGQADSMCNFLQTVMNSYFGRADIAATPPAIIPQFIVRGYLKKPLSMPTGRTQKTYRIVFAESAPNVGELVLARIPFFGRSRFSMALNGVTGAVKVNVYGVFINPGTAGGAASTWTQRSLLTSITPAGSPALYDFQNKFFHAIEVTLSNGAPTAIASTLCAVTADATF